MKITKKIHIWKLTCSTNLLRAQKAVVEFYWICGQQLDLLSNASPPFYVEEFPGFPEKELTSWESNILWSLKQYEHLDKPLVVWDIIAALLAFKQTASKFVEHIMLKWLSFAFMGSNVDLSAEKILLHASRSLSKINSRQLHLLNIFCRRVMLSELKADQINSKLQNLGGLCGAEGGQLTTWMDLLFCSERELRERLVGFSFSAFKNVISHSATTASRSGYWYPDGLAQMEQWVALNREHVRNELKVLASEVGLHERRYTSPLSYMVQISSPDLFDLVIYDSSIALINKILFQMLYKTQSNDSSPFSLYMNYAGHHIIYFSSEQTPMQGMYSSRAM